MDFKFNEYELSQTPDLNSLVMNNLSPLYRFAFKYCASKRNPHILCNALHLSFKMNRNYDWRTINC